MSTPSRSEGRPGYRAIGVAGRDAVPDALVDPEWQRLPWADIRNPLAGLPADLAAFIREQIRSFLHFQVLLALSDNGGALPEPAVIQITGKPRRELRTATQPLVRTGLLVRQGTQPPVYRLTDDATLRARWHEVTRWLDQEPTARLRLALYLATLRIHELSEDLATRRLVERAKGLLMQRLGLTEDEAHRRLIKASRDRNIPLRRLAEAIISAGDLLST